MSQALHTPGLPADAVLRVDHLSISFGGLVAVDDFSFTVGEQEIFGLIGPNGAGKTTVFNCITQFYKPDTGSVLFRAADGREIDLVGQKVDQVIGLGLARTFQNVELIRELSILDNLLIGAHTKYRTSVLAQVLRLPGARREEGAMRRRAEEVLENLGIYGLRHHLAGGQPYGVLKKVELARTLMSAPRLIILDEPAAGLNDGETVQLAEIIQNIRRQYQCAIFLIEHDMRLIMSICDRVCAISFGKFLACDTPKSIQANRTVQEAYLGEDEPNG